MQILTYRIIKKEKSFKYKDFIIYVERRDPSVTLEADWVGFTVPNEFVVGYGLDYDEKYRALPYVGILKEEVYK